MSSASLDQQSYQAYKQLDAIQDIIDQALTHPNISLRSIAKFYDLQCRLTLKRLELRIINMGYNETPLI